ncbi:polymorphic PE/PPE family protein [Mycobacterium xenopi 4042]|uniref:Polymorphic PE/PPE family protein n=1 Tax=Mycobacterium xenopi 4042 TaxID=1299334 RepID=X8AFF3_MYCXE|nr:polymorphic PE/PPE family protein [Mycobacterium xenopi 4042]
MSNSAIIGALQAGNFGSAASDLIQASPLRAPPQRVRPRLWVPGRRFRRVGGAVATNAVGRRRGWCPRGAVLASAGQASAVGGLSVPPSWAAETTPVSTAPRRGWLARLDGRHTRQRAAATVPAGCRRWPRLAKPPDSAHRATASNPR